LNKIKSITITLACTFLISASNATQTDDFSQNIANKKTKITDSKKLDYTNELLGTNVIKWFFWMTKSGRVFIADTRAGETADTTTIWEHSLTNFTWTPVSGGNVDKIFSTISLSSDGRSITLSTDSSSSSSNLSTTKTANNAAITGAWTVSSGSAAMSLLLVSFDNKHYFSTQQLLGEGGKIGGVEIGGYTLSGENFTNADAKNVNTNVGDTAKDATFTYNSSNDSLNFETISMKRVNDSTKNYVGAWLANYKEFKVSNVNHYKAVLLVLNSDNRYMQADIDTSKETIHTAIVNSDGGKYNMTEFGSYSIDSNGNTSFTIDKDTNLALICNDDGSGTGCNTVAGDSNFDYGFDSATSVSTTVKDNTMTMTVIDPKETQTLVFTKIIKDGISLMSDIN